MHLAARLQCPSLSSGATPPDKVAHPAAPRLIQFQILSHDSDVFVAAAGDVDDYDF